MFTMMNHARLGTGMQGLCLGEASFQGAIKYANDRLQMRALTGPKAPDKAPTRSSSIRTCAACC
jgi:alkylation response protein AidB-like acyl-CoA dehydrogenase